MKATLAGIRWFFSPCPDCSGKGYVIKTHHWHNDTIRHRVECRTCRGFAQLRTIGNIDNPTRSGIARKVLAETVKK